MFDYDLALREGRKNYSALQNSRVEEKSFSRALDFHEIIAASEPWNFAAQRMQVTIERLDTEEHGYRLDTRNRNDLQMLERFRLEYIIKLEYFKRVYALRWNDLPQSHLR